MTARPLFFLPTILMTACGWFGDDLPPKTRCHKEGRIPYEDLRPIGDSVWIRGTVPGVTEGQVRFHEELNGELTLICLGVVCDEKFEVEAPAQSDAPIHVVVVELAEGESVDGSHQWGALAEPLPLAGKDHQVEISLGQRPSWTKNLKPSADRIAQREDVFHREEPPPP